MLLAELGGGILKCRLASLLQSSLSEKMMRSVTLVAGMILIALGGYLIGSMVMRVKHPERQDKEPAEMVSNIIQRSLGDAKDSSLVDNDTTVYLK